MNFLKKCMPVLVALILIVVISGAFIVPELVERITYSTEHYDMNEYYKIYESDDVPIVLQSEILENKAKKNFGTFYFDLDTVKTYFTARFYVNEKENVICFTLPDKVVKAEIGEEVDMYYMGDEVVSTQYPIAYMKNEVLYIAVDFVKQFTDFSYQVFESPTRMQVYTEWPTLKAAKIKKENGVRYRGGVKSEILTSVQENDVVYILEELEEWDKVQTQDGFIGYIEKKVLSEAYEYQVPEVHDAIEMVYQMNAYPGKVNMAFHHLFAENGGDLLKKDLAKANTVNVVAPTWFRISDSNGNIQSFANQSYVKTAHDMGLQVWAVFTDVDEISKQVDQYSLYSSSLAREALINNLISKVQDYGIDGINIDIETITAETGPHFVQFLRELSIETRKNGIILSVDNYVPIGNTNYYNRKEQGIVCDYVVIMGYDEHWAGSDEAGSVASYNYVKNGIENTVANVPNEKVINAIPLYTRVWCTSGGKVTSETVGMQTAIEWAANKNATVNWDEESGQNYARLESGDKVYECWLEDKDSITKKTELMQNYGIAGIAEWKLGFDTSEAWECIDAYMAK